MLSLAARGLTTGEVAAHFAEVYGAPALHSADAGHTAQELLRAPGPDRAIAAVVPAPQA